MRKSIIFNHLLQLEFSEVMNISQELTVVAVLQKLQRRHGLNV